jgi:hypothetical protein
MCDRKNCIAIGAPLDGFQRALPGALSIVLRMKSGHLGRFFMGSLTSACGASSRADDDAPQEQVGYPLDKKGNFRIPGIGRAPEAGFLNGKVVAEDSIF